MMNDKSDAGAFYFNEIFIAFRVFWKLSENKKQVIQMKLPPIIDLPCLNKFI